METQEQKNQTEPVTKIQEKSKKKNVKLFLIVIIIALLGSGGSYYFFRSGSSTPQLNLSPINQEKSGAILTKREKF